VRTIGIVFFDDTGETKSSVFPARSAWRLRNRFEPKHIAHYLLQKIGTHITFAHVEFIRGEIDQPRSARCCRDSPDTHHGTMSDGLRL
jgi:hypothetical protein